MTFELAATRAASLVLAVAATLAGCGGGSTESAMSATAETGAATADTSTIAAVDASTATAASQDAITADIAANGTTTADAAQAVAAKLAALVSDDTTTTTDTSASTGATTTTIASVTNNAVATTPSLTTLAGASSTASDGLVTAPTEGSATATPAVSTSVGATSGVVTVTNPATSKSARSGVGINLAGITSYSSETPTIDLMKKSSGWLTQCVYGQGCVKTYPKGASSFDTLEEAKLDVDDAGWVKSLPSSSDGSVMFRTATTKVAENGVQVAGNYTVVYDGSGTVVYSGAAKKVAASSRAGRDIVSVENTDTLPFYLSITSTDPANYVRNIRVYPPGGACSGDYSTYVASEAACTSGKGNFVAFENFPAASSLWHPAFLKSLKGFRTIRFMDWGMTNATPAVNWTDRKPTNARTWSGTVGAPVERMFELASATGADSWMNIPPYATDAYVKSFAQLAHTHLASGTKLYLEYGNEMWNYSFAATKWVAKQSQTQFASQLAAGGNPGVLQMNWYAMRLVQVCKIVKAEFGADASRVQCVANTQAANAWATGQTLNCVYAKPLLGGQPCGKQIDGVAIAPYFGMYIGSVKLAPTVIGWTTESDGGLNKMFQELTGANELGQAVTAPLTAFGSNAATGAIAQVTSWMVANKAAADVYGLPMYAYEGGQGLVSGNNDPTVLNLEYAANRDPRMGAAYQKMLTAWKSAGGQTFMLFNDVAKYSKSGMWGMRENQFDETAVKWKAAVNWRDKVSCWWTGC